MDEQSLRIILEGGGGPGGKALRAALKLPGLAYGEVMRLRRFAYRRGIKPSFAAAVPVLSVGNLTAGGTGKTPFTVLLAGICLDLGKRPAILLRGYRAEGGESDEAALYRRLVPDAIVEVGADRVQSSGKAVSAGAQVLLLDDGFQHLRLRRDLDIVLVDAASPWGGGTPIPGGLLREPRSALAQAGAVVVTRSDQVDAAALEGIKRQIAGLAPSAALFAAVHRPSRLADANGRSLRLEFLAGKKVIALCGIARPEAFAKTLASLGAEVAEVAAGGDHRAFPVSFLEKTVSRAKKLGALVVTTEKDSGRESFRIFADNTDSGGILVLGIEQAVDDRVGLERLVAETLDGDSGDSFRRFMDK